MHEPPSDPTSVYLLGCARAGDQAALDELCRRYIPRLQNWAAGRLPHHARDLRDTGDVVQEALIKAIRNLDSFEFRNDASLLVYLRHAVQNRIRDEVRRANRAPEMVDAENNLESSPGGPSPYDELLGEEAVDRYERALQRIRPSDREAVIAGFELGSEYEEIARLLDKPSADAARMTVARALARLAEEMADEE